MTRREGRFVYLNTGTYVLGTETYVLMLGILAVRKAEKSLSSWNLHFSGERHFTTLAGVAWLECPVHQKVAGLFVPSSLEKKNSQKSQIQQSYVTSRRKVKQGSG